MTSNFHCMVCDIAWAMRMSEQEFYDRYSPEERVQIVATYRSQNNRTMVERAFPLKGK